MVLPPAFYARPAEIVARALLGHSVVSSVGGVRCSATIVETEAYAGPHDQASHAHRRIGRTDRNAAMFGPPGTTYIYRSYGIHWCLNFVTDAESFPAAVLVRAAVPAAGIETMRERRLGRPDIELLRGPGKLAQALGLTGELNHHPLDRPPLWAEQGAGVPDDVVERGPRIGITRAAEWPLRFWVRGSRWASR